jgi:hypothetical protein
VVALVADGLTNRGVATELGLCEHTTKIYLLRISIKWEFRAASTSFSMPWRTAKSPVRMDAGQQCFGIEGARDVQCRYAKQPGDRAVTSAESPTLSHSQVARRWTVIASGLLLLALALIVIYTAPNAFYSPVALVTVAAIGLAALLLQVRFRLDLPNIHSPLWLNVLGIVCALLSLFANNLHITPRILELVAFAAVICFGISGSLILRALRRRVPPPPSTATE